MSSGTSFTTNPLPTVSISLYVSDIYKKSLFCLEPAHTLFPTILREPKSKEVTTSPKDKTLFLFSRMKPLFNSQCKTHEIYNLLSNIYSLYDN